MRKSQMSPEQRTDRSVFVESLSAAGWTGSTFNEQFDQGLWVRPEARMDYATPTIDLSFDFYAEDPRVILYITSKQGKSLDLVFRPEDRLRALLDAVIGLQESLAPGNIQESVEELLVVCPKIFKISASGDKMIPVRSAKPTRKRGR